MIIASDLDVAWLAGLLEGEGCFWFGDRGRVVIRLAMTDLDVVERAAAIMGGVIEKPRLPKEANRKIVYACRVSGDDAIAWMTRLRPMMGKRRQAKIDEVMAYRASRPGKGRWIRPRSTHCKAGHELTPENTVMVLGGSKKYPDSHRQYPRCRICVHAKDELASKRKLARRHSDPEYRTKVYARNAATKRKLRAAKKAAGLTTGAQQEGATL